MTTKGRVSKIRPIRRALLADHAQIEKLLTRLREEAAAEARPALERTWAELERAVLDHFDGEEMFLFPLLAEHDTAEHAVLCSDHAAIRGLLGELGVAVELHALRLATLDALLVLLRAHAAREDRTLYAWAERAEAVGPRFFLRWRKRRAAARPRASDEPAARDAAVDEASRESFPASDAPAFAAHRGGARRR